MIAVRPATRADFAAVAELLVRASRARDDVEAKERRVACVLGGHPWPDDGIASLVAEDDTGKLQAFLAVVPRPMTLRGRPVRAAVAGPLAVHPECKTFVGTRLLRRFLEGPQDVSFMDTGLCATRSVWERLGGSAAVLYNLSWTRPLRPAAWALGRLRASLGRAATLARPGAWLADAALRRMPGSPFRPVAAPTSHDAGVEELSACITRVAGAWLHACAAPAPLAWLLARAAEQAGAPLVNLVVGANGAPHGYAVMSVPRGGVAQVVQMAVADANLADGVVRAMFARASAAGCVAITGRVDTRFLNDLTDRGALLHASGLQTLVHARDAALVRHVERGEAVLGRLDGGWWVGV